MKAKNPQSVGKYCGNAANTKKAPGAVTYASLEIEILKIKDRLLNKRTELMYKCPHRRKHRLMMVDETGP